MSTEITPELFSIQAEQNVLGAMVLNQSCIPAVAAVVTADSFFRADHRDIFRACVDLEAGRSPVDLITVCERIGMDKIVYVGDLARNCTSVSNAAFYAAIVQERYDRRRLVAAGIAAEGMARSAIPLMDAVGKVRSQIDDIGPQATGGSKSVDEYMADWKEELHERMKRGDALQGLPTGFNELNQRWFGLCEPDLIIVAGRPSMGKTTFALNLAESVVANGGSILFFSLEMSARQLTDKRVAAITGIPLETIRRASFSADQWGKVGDAAHTIKNRKFVINETSGISVDAARMICMSHKSRHGLDAVFFDYLGLMTKPGSESRLQEIRAISAGLKGIAKDLKVPVVALSQLNRKCEDRANKRPMMADLRESGDIEQDADIVSFVYRHERYEPGIKEWHGIAEIITEKHRNGEIGTDFVGCELAASRFFSLDYPFSPPGTKANNNNGRDL